MPERRFIRVSLILTEKEYDKLSREASLERSLEEHMRLKMGLSYQAYGWAKYKKEHGE